MALPKEMIQDHFEFCVDAIRKYWALGPFDPVPNLVHYDIRLLGMVKVG